MKIQNWKGAVSKMSEGKVIKRDKSIVDFDRHKIENAIAKAYKEVYPNINIDNYCSTIIKVTDKIITMSQYTYVVLKPELLFYFTLFF